MRVYGNAKVVDSSESNVFKKSFRLSLVCIMFFSLFFGSSITHADINSKKSHLEEHIYHLSDHVLYQLKINNDINSKFYYHSEDLENIQKINVRDRLSIPVNILLNDINNEIIKSCVDIHI